MENKILISVLIPTYNRPDYLKECLDSVLSQKWFWNSELEFIISDNSNNDDSKDILKKYIKDNPEIKIIYNKNKENLWMVWNFNKLLELKTWEYFIFLSDDDKFYHKGSLKILYDNLLKNNVDVCYWKYKTINSNDEIKDFIPHDKIWNEQFYYDSLKEQLDWHSISFGWILYKDFWYKYDKNAWLWCDWDFNIQYLVKNKKILLINENTLIYRIHKNQDSSNINYSNYLKSSIYIINKQNISFKLKIFFYLKHIKIATMIFLIQLSQKLWIYNFIKK